MYRGRESDEGGVPRSAVHVGAIRRRPAHFDVGSRHLQLAMSGR
jgi:hypothetical protein